MLIFSRFNEKTTNNFKEITGILGDAIYCSKNVKMAEEILGEEFKGRGEEYRIIFSKVFQKIREIRKKNDQDILQRENLMVKIREELNQKQEENQKLEKNMKNCDKNIQETYQCIISQQQNQVIGIFSKNNNLKKKKNNYFFKIQILQKEISKLKSDTASLKRSFEQQMQEYEQTAEKFRSQQETDIKKLTQERDDLKLV